MKRRIASAFLVLVLAVMAGTLAALRTRWVGERVCALAAARARSAPGKPLAIGACRIEPFRLELVAEGVRLGPAAAPTFEADVVRARLAPVQTLGKRLELAELSVARPRIVAAVPSSRTGAPAACPPPALGLIELHRVTVDDGSLDLTLPGGGRIVVSRFDIRSARSTVARTLRSLAAKPRSDVVLEAGPANVDAAGRRIAVTRARIDAQLTGDLSRVVLRGAELDGEGLRLGARGEVANVCAPALDVTVTASGAVLDFLALLGSSGVPAGGEASVDVALRGPPARLAVRGDLRFHGATIGQFVPGDARVLFRRSGGEIVLDRIEVPFASGGVAVAHGSVRLDRQLSTTADVEVRDVEFAEILSRVGVPGSWVMMRDSARVRLAGRLVPLDLAGDASVEVKEFHVLTHSWERHQQGEPDVLDLRHARVDTGVRVTRDAVRLERARIRAGEATLGADAELPVVAGRGYRIGFDGGVDLGELRHVSSVPWAGRASVRGVIAAIGGYGDPVIEGTARVEGFRFLKLDLGDLTTSAASYARGTLELGGIEGLKNETRYHGTVAVDLSRSPAPVATARIAAEGRLRDLFEAAMPWQPGARRLRDAVDAGVEAEATATGPVTALDVDFRSRLGRGRLLGREFDAGTAAGRIERGERVVFERAELRAGSGSATASGWIGFGLEVPWDLRLAFAGVRLADLALPVGPLAGSASGSATLTGSADEPVLRFAANGDGVALRDVPVGTIQLGGSLVGPRLAVTGSVEGVAFSGSARLEDDLPFEARADLDLDDISRFFANGPPAGLRASVQGEATAAGSLASIENARATIRINRLAGGFGDFRVESPNPVVVSLAEGRVDVEGLSLRGANTELAVSGSREADGRLDLSAAGSVDLRLLAGLVPQVSSPRGQLAVEAHVGGTLADPLLVGAGRVHGMGFQVRDLPIVFSAVGGDLAFSQNRILFDRLSATLNGGRADMRGEIELSRLVPVRVRVDATLDEVAWSIPADLPITVEGPLAMTGTPDALTLTGRLHVVRALYTRRVDIEKNLLEFRRRRAPAPRAYDKSADWLRYDLALVVDGDARIDNDLVHGGVRGELQVTGNLGALGAVGTLAMTAGSRATFRGNEFNLSHAVMELTDSHRVHAALDVHGEATVRDYQVFMHLFGTLDEPQLQLTSSPPLSQEDLLTLLSLGFTTRDTAATTSGVGGAATAAAAQALFSVSGLDDQVKRFLPRDGFLKDLSVRITTSYSEASGQVEPSAEFESRVMHDRLRLRYLAPLAGAHSQRAQAELRMSDHSSLQYQWDNDNPDVASGGDHGVDLKLRWEWND